MKPLIASLIRYDQRLSAYFAAVGRTGLKKGLTLFTNLGSGYVCFPVYGILFFFCGTAYQRVWGAVLAAELSGLLVIVILRYSVRRERPQPAYRRAVLTSWNRYSFPSLHAYRAFMLCAVPGAAYPGLLAGFVPFALVIGFSRLYLLKHYLSDIIVGAMLGIAMGYGAFRLGGLP